MTDGILATDGAPRDLGFDQGLACRAALQSRYRAQPLGTRLLQRLGLGAGSGDRVDRDLTRHFPQQSEAVDGLVRGAGVPRRWLVEALNAEFRGSAGTPGETVVAVDRSLAPEGAQLLRGFAATPLVRRVAPDGGLASIELTWPWLTTALAGVNEGGLAAVSLTRAGAPGSHACAAPAGLLIQDCLSRFDSVDGAVDWCRGRPAGGFATLLVADVRGDVLAIEVAGDERRVVRPKDGLLVDGTAVGDAAASIRRAAPLVKGALAEVLGGQGALLDPVGRRLGLFESASRLAVWLDVRADSPR